MALSPTGPLNQLDIYRIVNAFDQDYFKTTKPLRNAQVDRVIVIIQLERMLYSHLPVDELVNEIMRRCLEYSPSVGALLMYYKNTPAIVVLHPLPLSYNNEFINNASKSLLVRLKQTLANGEFASYQQLMASVFTHHFNKLTTDQKIELIRKSNITPWEQKSISQKLELLGRIQAPTLWGKAKVSLQFLSWKVQFAAVWVLRHHIISWVFWSISCMFYTILMAVYATAIALQLARLSPRTAGYSSYVTGTTIYQAFMKEYIMIPMIFYILFFVQMGIVWTTLGFSALAKQIPIFSKSVQEKGARDQLESWKHLKNLKDLFLLVYKTPAESSGQCQNLEKLLLQLINEAKITTKQETFAKAQLPGLMNNWLQLTLPSDTDTGSSQTLQ